MWSAKFVVAGKHALVTVLVAILSSVLVFVIWFPGDFAEIMPGTKLFLLVVGIEVVLGPCMSLVIYNPQKNKTELYRDYATIIVIQLSALLYGLYSVAQTRPVFMVFVKDRLEIVSAAEIDSADLSAAAHPQFNHLPWLGPKIVCARSPATWEEREFLLFTAIPAGKDVQNLPLYFNQCAVGEIFKAAKPLAHLSELIVARKNSGAESSLKPYLVNGQQYSWLPVVSRFGVRVVLIDENDALVKYIFFDPF